MYIMKIKRKLKPIRHYCYDTKLIQKEGNYNINAISRSKNAGYLVFYLNYLQVK